MQSSKEGIKGLLKKNTVLRLLVSFGTWKNQHSGFLMFFVGLSPEPERQPETSPPAKRLPWEGV
jgi:hypothetical protein